MHVVLDWFKAVKGVLTSFYFPYTLLQYFNSDAYVLRKLTKSFQTKNYSYWQEIVCHR